MPTTKTLIRSSLGAIAAITALASAPAFASVSAPRAASLADWQERVEGEIANNLNNAVNVSGHDMLVARVAISFDADGRMAGTRLAKSSGNADADAEAQRVAAKIDYPELPTTLTGAPRTVLMEIYFGTANSQDRIRQAVADRHEKMAVLIANTDRTVRAAQGPVANPVG